MVLPRRQLPSDRRRARNMPTDRGFTLVELLISISLTALLFVSVYATVRLAADSLRGVERSVRQNEQRRALDRFVQRQFDHAVSDQRQAFDGGPRAMSFATMPTDGGSRTRVCRIYARRLGDGFSLRASLQRLQGDGRAIEATLASRLGGVRFSYWGRQQANQPYWSASWTSDRLPSLVRLTLDEGDGRRDWYFAVAGIGVDTVAAGR